MFRHAARSDPPAHDEERKDFWEGLLVYTVRKPCTYMPVYSVGDGYRVCAVHNMYILRVQN